VVPGHWKVCGELSQEIRMFRHKGGNPETELGRTLNESQRAVESEPGRLPRPRRIGKLRAARESDQPIVL
jgi:hypothetical protein